MEQKFGKNSIDIEALREFCEREGKMVEYRKGEQLEREGNFSPCPGKIFALAYQQKPSRNADDSCASDR